MPKLIGTVRAWWQTDAGRRTAKWGVTAVGALVQAGLLPLDQPIGPFSLGNLLVLFGLSVPSGQVNSTPPPKV